jgi:hypothetical protein
MSAQIEAGRALPAHQYPARGVLTPASVLFRMMIIGCDFHPTWQQIAWLDSETGKPEERKLVHASGDTKAFYQQLAAPLNLLWQSKRCSGTTGQFCP